jgi:hypothetical protein
MKIKVLAILLGLMLPTMAWADRAPLDQKTLAHGAVTGTLCKAEVSTGDCADGDEIVLDARGFQSITFFSGDSTDDTYACDVIMNATGHDAAATAGEGQDITASQITDSNEILSIAAPLGFLWVNCTTITTSVTITYVALPLTK